MISIAIFKKSDINKNSLNQLVLDGCARKTQGAGVERLLRKEFNPDAAFRKP
jgi:hypothetical protein